MKSKKEVIAQGPTGNEGEWIRPMEPPWAGAQEGGSPKRRAGAEPRGLLECPHGQVTAPRRGRRLDSPEKRSHRSSKLRDTRHRRLTSGTFCLLPHPVPSTLSPRDKFLGRTAGECFLEKLHGHPPAPQKRRFPSSENQEVTSQQNYIQRRQKGPPRFQRYFRMLYSETWSDS